MYNFSVIETEKKFLITQKLKKISFIYIFEKGKSISSTLNSISYRFTYLSRYHDFIIIIIIIIIKKLRSKMFIHNIIIPVNNIYIFFVTIYLFSFFFWLVKIHINKL